jgi:hypothetical protein
MTMNVNSRKPWTPVDVYDLRQALGRGTPIDQVADFLSRDVSEVRAKASQLGLLGTGGHGVAGHARTNVRHAYAAKGRRYRRRTERGSA